MGKILKIILIIVVIVILLVLITLGLGNTMFKRQVQNEVIKLFRESEDTSDRIFGYDFITTLPEPVQRYFKYSLPDEQKYISYVKLKHTGTFRTKVDQKWMPISGSEYFSTQRPGFVWFASVKPFPLIWITARDTYYKGNGNVLIKLLSLFTIGNSMGKEVNQATLTRFIAEAPWFPTALLPGDYLKWEAIDSNSAKVIVSDSRIDISGIFYFNEKGEITQFTADRYMNTTKEKWTCYYKNYKDFDGVKVPTDGEVVWNLKSGNFSYARFKLTDIEFNNPSFYK
jgi:hypothetical protein